MNMRQKDQEQLMAILAEAGPKGRELANVISNRKPVEITLHVHIYSSGPMVIGSDVAETLLPLLSGIHDIGKSQEQH